MAIPLTINGATFEYPQNFDENWGVEATGWAQAVTNGLLQMSGGSFPITADVNFGPNFGLLSKYFETRSSNPATTGTVRLSSADAGIAFRNNANTGNLIITTNSSDQLLYNGTPIGNGVSSVSGTTNQITSTGGTTPVLAIANPLILPGAMTAGGAIAMAANKITGLAAGTTNGDAIRYEQIGFNAAGYIIGTIVQTVQFRDTALTTTTSATYQSTTTAATITPKATTHKIKISVSGFLDNLNIQSADVSATIFRNSTDLDSTGTQGFAALGGGNTAIAINVPASMIYEDSPATTSSVTYTVKIKVAVGSGTATWNTNAASAVILLEEVAF